MSLEFLKDRFSSTLYTPFLERLKIIYNAMDKKYNEAAIYYGFTCKGCADNCCRTRFYHHTLLEYLYLLQGYHTLSGERQKKINRRAFKVCKKTEEADTKAISVRVMCPVNLDGLCTLYAYRPMICRLHGIPHELHRPGQNLLYSPGCEDFRKQSGEKEYFAFNRTRYYFKMAQLEKELKLTLGITKKIKLTVAQMLIS